MKETPDRTPDLTTESMKIWKVDEEEYNKTKGIKVKYKDAEIELIDFTPVKNEKNEIIFAWKIKKEEKTILFIKLKDCDKSNQIEALLKSAVYINGYALQDAKENIKSIYSQKESIGKLK